VNGVETDVAAISSEPLLDPENFPFSESELFAAACLWLDAEIARQLTDQLSESSRGDVAIRAEQNRERRQPAKPSFAAERDLWKFPEFIQIEWLWPALSVLSPSAAARVELWMEGHWRFRYSMEIRIVNKRHAEESGLYPSRAERIEWLRALGEDVDRIPPQMGIHHPRIVLPEPTEEMRRAVSELIEAERNSWRVLVKESRSRLDSRRAV